MKFIIGIIFIVQGGYLVEERLIGEYCTDWWDKRLVIIERKDPQPYENHFIHLFEDKPVLGHYCKEAP
jgi:hypothetical protein